VKGVKMMSKKYKILAICLALIMVVSLAACTSSDGSADASEPGGSSSVDGSEPESPGTSDETESFTVLTVRWTDAWPTDFLKTGIMAELEAEHNVDIDWQVYYYSDWAEQKSLLLASGNLPDAFWGSNGILDTDIAQNSSYFIDLTDLITENMPNLTAIFEKDSSMRAMVTTREGQILSLPKRLPLRPQVNDVMFINQTWLDNLGIDMPTTYLELQDVLRAFVTQDPNGNGINDEYGYSYRQSLETDLRHIMSSFGTQVSRQNNFMGMIDDEPVFMPIHENYYNAVQWVHELYQEGLIDPEGFTQDASMVTAKTQDPEGALVGIVFGWTADAQVGVNVGDFAIVPAIAGPDGNRYVEHNPEYLDNSRNEVVVTSSCSNPAKLLQWADSFYTDEVTLQTYYGSISDGKITANADGTYEVLVPSDGSSLDTSAWSFSFRDFGPKYMDKAFEDNVILPSDQGDGVKLAQDSVNIAYITTTFPVVAYTAEQAMELASLSTTIYDYVKAQYAHWVVDGGVEEEWDDYLAQLDAMGLQELIAIQIDAYEAYISNLG